MQSMDAIRSSSVRLRSIAPCQGMGTASSLKLRPVACCLAPMRRYTWWNRLSTGGPALATITSCIFGSDPGSLAIDSESRASRLLLAPEPTRTVCASYRLLGSTSANTTAPALAHVSAGATAGRGLVLLVVSQCNRMGIQRAIDCRPEAARVCCCVPVDARGKRLPGGHRERDTQPEPTFWF